ncbi:MAG: DNA polymerase III subunit gamma/tau [Spirochaetales bacterium]|nr:DNA polymerase III subunit gamma/tau [Spirochaetales bacterium]
MAYEVTATRRRPQTLKQLVGQEFVVSTIENSIAKEQIAHAYLFSGPRGTGKTSSARILAKSLNCQEGPTAEPCGKCPNCVEITKGNSLDVIEIDGASNTGVNDIREIKDEVLFAPTNSRYKVYIIDEVHMLSNSAFNALLKTIEEPPPYIIFIFATTEIHKVPATIRSRCQQFNFRLFSLDTVKEQLAQACQEMEIQYDEDALLWIAKEGTGSMRDSYTLFDQVVSFSGKHITVEKIREKLGLVGLDRINELARLIAEGGIGPVMESADRILAAGVSVEQFLVEMAEYFRNILLLKSGVEKESLLGSTPESFDKEVVSSFTENQLIEGSRMIFQLYKDVRYSLNQRFELELLLSRLVKLRSYFGAEELLGQIRNLKEQLTGGPIQVGETGADASSSEGDKKKSLNESSSGENLKVPTERTTPSEQETMSPPGSDSANEEGEGSTGDAARDFFTMFSDKKRAPSPQDSIEEKAPPAEEQTPARTEPEESPSADGAAWNSEDAPLPEPPAFVMEEEDPELPPPEEGGDWWENLLNRMKKDGNVVLMGSMSKGMHRLEEERITLIFPTQYIAESIEREKNYIQELIAQVMGRSYELNIIIEKPKVKNEEKEVDEKVDLFVRIFGGTVIQGGTGDKK